MSTNPITLTKTGVALGTTPDTDYPLVLYATGEIALAQSVIVQQDGSTLEWTGTITQLIVDPNIWLATLQFTGSASLLARKSTTQVESAIGNVFTITILDDAVPPQPLSNDLNITLNPYEE